MKIINNFKIIGISVHTTNKANQSAQDLGKLWEQFFINNILDKVSNKLNNSIYAVYTDYKSDYTEEYTAIIGVSVAEIDQIPDGLIGREFPSESFQIFKAKGEMPNAVANSWSDIWKRDKELKRKYTYDFEVYDENSQNGENSVVDIYIAI